MIRGSWLLIPAALGCATPAHADLQLCNRMSYAVDAAIAVERRAVISTYGWFHVDPGQCRAVAEGALDGETLYLHARTPAFYGASPLPKTSHAEFCVDEKNFSIADARSCRAERMTGFTAVKPSQSDQGLTVNLAEEAEYTPEQARLAGIQRLLTIAGYDPGAIDGLSGPKTEATIAKFAQDRKLSAGASAPDFFSQLYAVAQNPQGGFSWCNETSYPVMASIGLADGAAVVTRGWYRIEPGQCVKPDMRGDQQKIYTYAEAVDANGTLVKKGEQPLAWGGDKMLCTREGKFEFDDQSDCAARGLQSSPFAAIDLAGRPASVVRFKEP
jgi:uncharacterized membrane protein